MMHRYLLEKKNVSAVSSGGKRLYGWGLNATGELGINSSAFSTSSPVQVGTLSWAKVSVGGSDGGNATLAIRSDGLLFAWGDGFSGALGNSFTSILPRNDVSGSSSWVQISVNGRIGAAIRSDGALHTWGTNTYYMLGNSSTLSNYQLLATKVGTSSWSQVSVGQTHVLAIRSDGGLFAWGTNIYGQLGDSTVIDKSSPIQIGTSSWTRVSAGYNNSYGITTTGALFSWGDYGNGQLGNSSSWYVSNNGVSGGFSWTRVSVGYNHVLAIRSDGLLFAWGLNDVGQFGNSSTESIRSLYSPLQIGTSSWSQIAAGPYFSLGLLATTGALYAWGINGSGQLGDGSTVNKSSPVKIGALSWSQISTGDNHSLGLLATTGALYAWGLNSGGQLGNSDAGLVSQSSPVHIGALSWSKISAGSGFSAGILTTGALYTWGYNGQAALGNGDATLANQSSPVHIGTLSWSQVTTGMYHSLGLLATTGALYAWGYNAQGQLGNGDAGLATQSSPVKIGNSSWTQVTATQLNSFAILTTGALYGWGYGPNGTLNTTLTDVSSPVKIGASSWAIIGSGSQNPGQVWGLTLPVGINNMQSLGAQNIIQGYARLSPVQIGTSSWSQVSASLNGHVLGLLATTGALYGWGINTNGELGDSSVVTKSSPVHIGALSWSQISAGTTYSLGLLATTGALYSWGSNAQGQLGNGDAGLATQSSPVHIGTSSWTYVAASAGSSSFGILTIGALYGWGSNFSGALGNNSVGLASVSAAVSSPVLISTSSWSKVASDGVVTLGLTNTGVNNFYSWGFISLLTYAYNPWLGYAASYSSPVQIGSSSWSQVATSGFHSLGITTSGALYAWGLNNYGQIGNNNGTSIVISSPVQIGSSSWSQVATGEYHSLALTVTNGSLYTWGYNTYYNLGDNTTVHKSSPVKIGTSSWTKVAGTYCGSFGITTTGSLYSWGADNGWQLAQNGTTAGIPTQIGSSSWSQISAGYTHTLGITTTGALFGWGGNDTFQLGFSPTSFNNPPTQIGSSSWSQISAGLGASSGITTNGRLFVWGNNNYGVSVADPNTVPYVSSPTQVGSSSWSQVGSGNYYTVAITV